ncbi:MAG: ABC transporter permease [Firmicutes bacterium]|nr:ABC transporter permease [Bacillota bacterium]
MFRYLKEIYWFIKDLVRSRTLIYELTKKEFKTKYLGSYLGIMWAFIQPIITILIFWFVFQMGFKSQPVANFPFVLWLMCGMIPWFFISESTSGATSSILDNSYLVKKVVFRVSILPIIKILSVLIIHLFFVVFLFLMFLFYGYVPVIFNIQVIYYLVATIFLVLSVSWITASLAVFIKDVPHIVTILVQFGFWLTPIFWNVRQLPLKYQKLFKLNPVYYIVEGYRNAMIDHKWFWNSQTNQTIYFWSLVFVLFAIGVIMFRKLRPHFADVL